MKLSLDLTSNINLIKSIMGYAVDVIVREFTIATCPPIKAATILIKGLAERNLVNDQVIGALMSSGRLINKGNNMNMFQMLKESGIPCTFVDEESFVNDMINQLTDGNTIVLIDQVDKALIVGSTGWKDRSITEPNAENVVRGPKDGFTENIEVNIALIRRRIKSTDLRLEISKIGSKTKTKVVVAYLEGVAKQEIIDEVRKRLGRIEIDSVLESGYIEELIEDKPLSPFPQIQQTERPDKVCAGLLQGKVAIIVDTSPHVLIVPVIFFEFIESADDYYERFLIGSFTRLIRIVAFIISVTAPALYIALTSFHQEMIPTTLALSIAASREGVPFPSIGEAFIMEGTFEILREAGLRLPKQAGQAVSIVGGIVIGQAAVQAGIVSQAMVIVVALTGISSFAIPAFNAAAAGRFIRFPLMLMASVLGLPGILAGLSIIFIHLCSLRSFGVSYVEPFASAKKNGFKDMIVRLPWWAMNRLPNYIARKEFSREKSNLKPGPNNDSR